MSSKLRRILFIAVIGLLLLACAIAVGTYWAVGPAWRCELPSEGPAAPGWSARRILSGGRSRCYYLYAPLELDATRAAPLVVSFHGFLSNPDSHALITGWHKLAAQEGFLLAYPQGTDFPQRWNASSTWGNPGVDDVQFFLDMLEDISTVAAFDRSRVYVNGFSNGGGMTVRIGCEAADVVAAIGSVAGAVVSLDDCSPTRPMPVMAFHGTADPLVDYAGRGMPGELLPWAANTTRAPTGFLGAEAWVALWAEANACDVESEAIPPQGKVTGERYVNCEEAAEVILYTIEGGGHTWPGGFPIPVGKTSNDIDATEELWRFFQEYSLDNQP